MERADPMSQVTWILGNGCNPPRAPNQQDGKSGTRGRRAASLEAGRRETAGGAAARIPFVDIKDITRPSSEAEAVGMERNFLNTHLQGKPAGDSVPYSTPVHSTFRVK